MSEIVAELWENTELLVRKELELAITEIERKADRLKDEVKRDVMLAAIGGAIAYAGGLALVAAAVLLLSKAVDPWISALIVGGILSAGGYAMLNRAKHVDYEPLTPTQTTQSVKRSAQTIKEAVHDATR